MGSCCLPRNNVAYRSDYTTNPNTNNLLSKTSLDFDTIDDGEEFRDMPSIENKFKGLGIKKMKAYKCELKIDDLNKMRDNFWEKKCKKNGRWKILRQACVYDNNKAAEYLTQNGFWTVNGCINLCTDSTNKVYKIPNYCINDPYFEKELIGIENKGKYCNEISIVVSDQNDCHIPMKIIENITGKELKEKICSMKNVDPSKVKCRLFFGGNELLDNQCIFQHKIKNGYTIQCLYSSVE